MSKCGVGELFTGEKRTHCELLANDLDCAVVPRTFEPGLDRRKRSRRLTCKDQLQARVAYSNEI
jgi:hypothetical protein